MDHQEQHHEHHRKEREEHKAAEKRHDQELARKPQYLHPLWFLLIGTVGVLVALFIWMMFFYR